MIIAGCGRNISQFWNNTQNSLQKIFDSLPDYKCVIIESNSSDNTLELLNKWAAEDSRRIVISLGWLHEPSRTRRIAICRNKYMEIVEPYFSQFSHIIMVDLDDVLGIEDNFKEQLNTCFLKEEWDGLGSNRREKYYDIWALRSKVLGIDYDCWEMVSKYKKPILTRNGFKYLNNSFNSLQTYVYRHQKAYPDTFEWIPVESAFCGLAIYKTSSIKGRRYTGETCEHVSFNKGLKMFINPGLISGN
jgi:glycosyltransferase involved in cell wall biosynthesis